MRSIPTRSAGWAACLAVLLLATAIVSVSGQSEEPGAPAVGVRVSGMTAGDVVSGAALTLTVEPVGFQLSADHLGDPPLAGMGHYHVHLDGSLRGIYTEPEAIVHLGDLLPGWHTLTVVPAANDRSGIPEAAVAIEFDYQPLSTVTVNLREWSLEPAELALTAGTWTFVAPNVGAIPHSLMIAGEGLRVGTPDTAYPAGDSQSFTVDLAPGTYEMLCPLPWHEGTGMVGTIVVAP